METDRMENIDVGHRVIGCRALTGFAEAIAERDLVGVGVCCADDAPAGEMCIEQLRERNPDITALDTSVGGAVRAATDLDKSG